MEMSNTLKHLCPKINGLGDRASALILVQDGLK